MIAKMLDFVAAVFKICDAVCIVFRAFMQKTTRIAIAPNSFARSFTVFVSK